MAHLRFCTQQQLSAQLKSIKIGWLRMRAELTSFTNYFIKRSTNIGQITSKLGVNNFQNTENNTLTGCVIHGKVFASLPSEIIDPYGDVYEEVRLVE